ncbi:restriction endonuclease subunit S [Mesorhizobium waimense]|uniref:Restriction endonuclease subunit S n=1 Tax=Mesorhizobium waimense TaxID=1300307 RepID=A0A3A5JZE9_9HYPH|nr:restriction endonuclease subunit S [Mesorhizobium waimense]RJT28398.1 restriction endonuclease subunit S [Mesorhizobium waimense]
MDRWISTTIGAQATLQRGFDITRKEQRYGPFPVISSGGVSSFHDEPKVKGPGVILGRKGVVGSVYFQRTDYWPHDTTLWVKDFHGNDERFVYYFFCSIADRLADLDVGSANPTLNRNHVHPIQLSWPPLQYQLKVAELLGSLDDKIELNRRMNETLEAMAQAIFRDWFVDFGPTRRKINGANDPVEVMGGLIVDPARALLLAGQFLGFGDDGMPVGWHQKGLDQIADFLNGLALQKFPAGEDADSLPVVKIAELRNGVTDKSGRASRSVPTKYIVKDADFLFSWSGSLLAKFWTGGEGALNQHLFKVSSDEFPAWFYSLWVQHHMAEFQQIAASKATTMGHIQREHLRAAKVVCPPSNALTAMTAVMGPLVERTVHNSIENKALAQTRDLLLPKLISGEILLRDVEDHLEAAQ